MNSYLEILFWTITIYIISVAIVHFIKVLREKKGEQRQSDQGCHLPSRRPHASNAFVIQAIR